MSTVTGTRTCANPLCKVASTGKCIEGLQLEECPTFGKLPFVDVDDATSAESSRAASEADMVILSPADLLSPDGAARVTRERETRVVALIGPNEAGKTSLIASLYEQFQRAPVAGCAFRWCSTLHGFERACHHARAVSRRGLPHTERTELASGLKFYHISVEAAGASRRDLLLADRPGEDYRGLADSPDLAKEFSEINRADTVTVLVDGKRLANLAERHNARAQTELTTQALVDSGALGDVRRLSMVLTKLDLVRAGDRAGETEKAFDGIVNKMRQRFSGAFDDISAFSVAASPASSSVARGYGVVGLFEYWMRDRGFKPVAVSASLPERFFQRFSGIEGGSA